MAKFRKAYVLLSGGLDSTTALYIAMEQADAVEAISVDYGQRHKKELEYAARSCKYFGIEHKILNIEGILSGKGVMLSDASVEIPNISYSDIKGVSPTYVPFRNGTLLSLITAQAQKWVNDEIQSLTDFNIAQHDIDLDGARELAVHQMRDSVAIYFGAHADDAANFAYPDCTNEFTGAMANAINVGSYYTTKLIVPLQWMNKQEIVEKGWKLNVNFANTWSCYAGGELHCGTCPTCRSRREAFVAASIEDPTEYAVQQAAE
jgi:7-cyano-7-deazaguanine synthase